MVHICLLETFLGTDFHLLIVELYVPNYNYYIFKMSSVSIWLVKWHN